MERENACLAQKMAAAWTKKVHFQINLTHFTKKLLQLII